MEDIEKISRLAQQCFSSNPVVIFGSGASSPHGLPGMPTLQEHLIQKVHADVGAEEDAWLLVKTALASGDHLEQAMTGKTLPATLVTKIVRATWDCVNAYDHALYRRAVSGSEVFPAGRLFRSLFSSSRTKINVVTTNYDRVLEYACDEANIIHSTGFTPGYLQQREGADQLKIMRGNQPARTVRIWKVHGSLDWFERPDQTTLAAPIFEIPDAALTPLIVTPGVSKFQRTYDEPFRSAIQGADQSLERAEGFLCVGFGFRDSHIEPRLVERCKKKNVPIVILALALTDETREFLRTKAGSSYLAFEKSGNSTKAYTSEHPDGIDIPDHEFWSLDGFLNLAT